ncbi:uncharacterized protein LOC8031369 [Ixodes scapularis]|uniref:uncharacterized protein LOC8031369 n=1 Tax=Ixodes scapularis TaxID=6945 RepID=UPI001A9CC1B2|nr:uncharacterized protein LOC8031369 [Ixodes scapularis]
MILLVLLAVFSSAHSGAVPRDGNPEPATNKDASKLFDRPQTFYLLYRSEKSDTKLGGESKCFQMKYYEARRGKKEFLTMLLFRDNSTGQMDVYSIVIVLEKSNESLEYYDRLVAQNHIATSYEAYDLLFTDYKTCFTLRRISDDLYQVWMIDRQNPTAINPGCESAYQGSVNEFGCAVPKPKYEIFDADICQ